MRTGLLILLLLCALAGCSDPNERNEKGQTPLLLAAEAGDLEAVRKLIAKGADIHARDHCLFTPLLRAAAGGHYAIAELLLQQGADPDDTDQGLYSAVMFAAGNNHPRLIELLLAHDAHIDLADASLGWSALIWAAREGHVESIAVLLAHGADIALRDTGGNTALLWAVKKGHRGAVRQLLDAGARPEETDGEGNSALAIAARRGDRDILELLVGVVTGPASRLLPEGALFAKVSPIQSRTKEPIMAREIIHTDKAPQAIGTYSQAVKVGSTVYLSGQIPLVPETMELVEGEMEAQIRRVFDNLGAVAEAAGGSLADMAKLNIFLTDLAHFPLVNQVMADYFQQPYPARAAIGVAALPKGAQVEMDGVLELE